MVGGAKVGPVSLPGSGVVPEGTVER